MSTPGAPAGVAPAGDLQAEIAYGMKSMKS